MTERRGLPPELATEVRRTLADLGAARLAPTAWPAVARDLAALAMAVERGSEATVRERLVPVAQAAFEGKVRGRLAGADRSAAVVVATKPTPALPIVGAVCGVVVVVLGYALGGWVVAAGTAAFALFIFAVAYAGSRTNLARTEARRARRAGLALTAERTETAPVAVHDAITRVNALLG